MDDRLYRKRPIYHEAQSPKYRKGYVHGIIQGIFIGVFCSIILLRLL